MLSLRLPDFSARWLAAGTATLLWALTAGSLVLWWLHLPRAAEPPAVVARLDQGMDTAQAQGAALRALGHTSTPAVASDVKKHFQLLGVIVSTEGHGSALISADGQTAKTYLLGQKLDGGWWVKELFPQRVVLQGSEGLMTVELQGYKKD